MSANNLRALLIEELKDIYDAEQRITKALPKMAKAADSEELKEAFQEHLAQTQEHVKRLEQVFEQLDETAKKKQCKAMTGLLEEGETDKKLTEIAQSLNIEAMDEEEGMGGNGGMSEEEVPVHAKRKNS